MARSLDPDDLMMRARRWLSTEALSGTELGERLRVSQPTVSRLIRQYREQILTTGKARRTRHILRRPVADVATPAPVHEIDRAGNSRRIAWLHPVATTGFHVESCCDDVDAATYDDWPWFLHQLRPSGFLGRRIAGLHPTLGLLEEPQLWSADQLLRYLNCLGWNGSGALIVGEPAFGQWLAAADAPTPVDVPPELLYPRLVDDVMAGAPPGSSAAGEQPKFLVARTVTRPERLVKFSPPTADAVGRRVADLLIAEHYALRTLSAEGFTAASSSIVEADGRVFLETERFDRTPAGRVGLLSLEALDLEFVGDGGRNRWPQIVRRLVDHGRLPEAVLGTVQRMHAFGHLIGNDDMHTGNLSFVVRGQRVLDVAPAYDMAPMRFSPVSGELPLRELTPAPRPEATRSAWAWAVAAAATCWRAVAEDARVSASFQQLAADCAARVESTRSLVRRLPE